MLSRQLVPRIRVDLPDSSLSPSTTLDIRDALGPAKLLPKLLAEEFVFDAADDDLDFEDGRLQDFPSFPMGCQPQLFILSSHRARLPFPVHPSAFELGDFCRDEEVACPLLTAPTAPRMKVMIREQLYVQKWVDKLTLDNPPKHIPWTCEKPAMKKKWIAEGSIFPADAIKSDKSSTKRRGAIIIDERLSALTEQKPHPRELCAFSEASVLTHASTESHTSTPQVPTNSADVNPATLRGESLHFPRYTGRALQTLSPPSVLPSGSPLGMTSNTSDAPLATRRGKPLSSLKLKRRVIEHLEYPDIPTPFRGSPNVCSPRFDNPPGPSFTDHKSMLLDLESKCASLGNGTPAYIQETLSPQTELTHSSLSVDEWAFARGLATFDDGLLGSIDSQVPGFIADTSIFLPDGSSTPVKCLSAAYAGFAPRLLSTPALQPPGNRSSDPPGVPLPPRPVLVNPSTPPHVRGILKKVKNVRFEDTNTKEFESGTSLVFPSQASPERPSPSVLAVPSERSCTPLPKLGKPSNGPVPVKALGRNIQMKSVPRSRLPPKRIKANGGVEHANLNVANAPETSNLTLATASTERPCRTAHAKENTDPAAVPQAKLKELSIPEIDVQRGIEGTAKSRLSAPLRNIFRFR